jgi:Ca2+/Na+ antiporter
MIGVVAGSAALGTGSIAGGVLFLVALVPLSMAWLREA